MKYKEVCSFLDDYQAQKGINLGLERVLAAAKELGDPQDKHKTIIVAGTNGKGSTVRAITLFLMQKNKKVGSFYSPHLVDYTERITVGNYQITKTKFAFIISKILDWKLHEKYSLTAFEIITLAAYDYFASLSLDYVVMEVGLGGRLDATNIAQKSLAVLSSISKDHVSFLGETLQEIATEKAGVIRYRNCFVIDQQDKVLSVFKKIAKEKKVKFHLVKKDSSLPFKGYQLFNISLAKAVVEFLLGPIRKHEMEKFVKKFSHPGRLELVSQDPFIIMDGAHNEGAMRKMCESIIAMCPERNYVVLFGALRRKDLNSLMNTLFRGLGFSINRLLLYEIKGDDRYSFQEMKEVALKICPSVEVLKIDNIKKSDKYFMRGSVNIICGSLYLIGEYKEL